MQNVNIIECKKCGKKFRCEEIGNIWPGGKEKEEANCPYCGEVAYSTMTSGFIHTYKIEKDNE